MTATHGNVPFFLIGRRNTLSPEVTYSVCRSGPPNTTFDGIAAVRFAEDADCSAGRIGDLNAELRRHIQESVGVYSHPIRAAAQ